MRVEGERAGLAMWAYQGEIVGQALFGTLASLEPSPTRQRWLRTLHTLEVRVAAMLEPLLTDLGLEARAASESVAQGEAMAAWSREAGWDAFLGSFEPVTEDALAKYEQLLCLVDTDEQTRIVHALIAHEEALREFAVAAATGRRQPLAAVHRVLRELSF